MDNDMLAIKAEKDKMIEQLAKLAKDKKDMEKAAEEMEVTKAKMNASLNEKHLELGVITDLIEKARRESKTTTALSSRVSSRKSSRATSPKGRQGGAGSLFASTSSKLKGKSVGN